MWGVLVMDLMESTADQGDDPAPAQNGQWQIDWCLEQDLKSGLNDKDESINGAFRMFHRPFRMFHRPFELNH